MCYLENGVIAEHGTAEQMFADPVRESTRRFLARSLER